MAKLKSCLADWGSHAWMAVVGTTGAAVPCLLDSAGQGLTLGEVGCGLLAGATAATAGVVTGRLGNVLHEGLNTRLTDPAALLRNHHLHALTAQAVSVVLNAAAEDEAFLPSEQERLRDLADAVVDEWEVLSEIDGFRQQVHGLATDDLKQWFHAALGDEASETPPRALTPEAWRVMLIAVGRKHECALDEPALQRVAERLSGQLPIAVRELLKEGGSAFNGLLLMLLGEIHESIREVLPLQLELLAGSQADQVELAKLIGSLHETARELMRRIDGVPDRDFFVTTFEAQSAAWDQLQSVVTRLGDESRQDHRITHEMLGEIRQLIADASIPAGLPSAQDVPTRAWSEPIQAGAAEGLVARQAERRQLRRILVDDAGQDRGRVAYIHGMPGVGKSYLLEWFIAKAWTPRHGAATDVTYVALRSSGEQVTAGADALLRDLCDRFKLAPTDPAIWQRLDQTLAEPGRLLVVENVDDEAAMLTVARIIHHLPRATCALTGRVAATGNASGWKAVPLGPFDVEDGLRQLKKELGRTAKTFADDELRGLVATLGGLSLALHLAAGHLLEGMSPAEFLAALRGSHFELRPADLADPRLAQDAARAILSASFEISWDAFGRLAGDKAERWLPALAALGHAPLTGFGASLGAAITGLSDEEFPHFCHTARRLSLLEAVPRTERADAAHRVHTLLAELLQRRVLADDVGQRVQRWFMDRFPEPQGEDAAAWIAINEEHAALVDWLSRATDCQIVDFARSGRHYAIDRGPFVAWTGAFVRSLGLTSDPDVRSDLLWGLANVAQESSELDAALQAAEDKSALEREREDDYELAIAQGVIADLLMARGELDEALRIRREEQLPVYERLGDVRELLVGRANLALILVSRGVDQDRDEARGLLEQARAAAEQMRLPEAEQIRSIQARHGWA